MCGGNIRLALEFVRDFIGSGHVNTEKILTIYHDTGRYDVPLHEFLRAVIYGDHEYYCPDTSRVINVFDISSNDGREHFLSPVLLNQLGRWAQQSVDEGYVSIDKIYSYMQNLGFNPLQIDYSINRLHRRNLLESPTGSRNGTVDDRPTHLRITTVGAYYIKRLVTQFTYVDAMVTDTPIIDPEVRKEITNVTDIIDRLPRAKVFCDYLDSQWQGLEGSKVAFDWPSVRKLINMDIDHINQRVSVSRNSA